MVKTELSESETVAKAESANDEVAIDSNGDSSHSDHHADEQSCVKRCSVVSSSVAVPVCILLLIISTDRCLN